MIKKYKANDVNVVESNDLNYQVLFLKIIIRSYLPIPFNRQAEQKKLMETLRIGPEILIPYEWQDFYSLYTGEK